ncbi:MAG: putative rane protein [Armatimonadetes bacterium]|nr:putative rane protein [Armatimonadota bacterium]
MRSERDRTTTGAAQEKPGKDVPPGWGQILKAMVAVHLARAAQRVLDRPRPVRRVPESGRRGGELVAAAPAVRTRTASEEKRPAEAATPAASHGVVAIARQVFGEFSRDNGTMMAAAVAFYLLLSLIPLVLVGIAILGWVLGDLQAQKQVLAFLKGYFPAQFDMLRGLVLEVKQQRGTIGLVGVGTLLLTATGGFATLETAINVAWGAPNRNAIMNKLFAVAMLFVIGTLLVLSLGATSLLQWAGSIPALSWLASNAALLLVGYALSVVITTVMFTFIYKFFPNTRCEWKPAAISGFLTALLWETFKQAYTWYSTSRWGDQSATYGAAAVFVGLVVWIYYSTTLVLLGAELTWVLSGCPSREPKEPGVRKAKA